MKLYKHIIILFVSLFMSGFIGRGQNVELNFLPILNGEGMKLERSVYIKSIDDTVEITQLRFYITNVKLQFENGTEVKEENSYHLMDLGNPESLKFSISTNKKSVLKSLTFSVGVDSLTNTLGVMEGDLDPLTGMYWSWNSGYINFKMEGTSTKSDARNQEFQFHVGGYNHPFNTCREITLPLKVESTSLNINVDCNYFLNQSNLPETFRIMSPGKLAYQLSNSFLDMFSIK